MALLSAQEVSAILKYVSVLSLKGFERGPPVSTGSVGDTDVSFVTERLERGPPVSTGSVGDTDEFCHVALLSAQEVSVILKYVSFLSPISFERVPPVSTGSVGDTEVCVIFVTERF